MNNDLISRQAAIGAVDKIIERDTSGSNDVVNAMIAWSEYIRALPSTQPEPKKGKWIYTGIEQNSFYCDKCLYLVKNMSYKFCPNCGADMRER